MFSDSDAMIGESDVDKIKEEPSESPSSNNVELLKKSQLQHNVGMLMKSSSPRDDGDDKINTDSSSHHSGNGEISPIQGKEKQYGKQYSCLICDKSFYPKNKLERHMSCHTKQKPFSCSQCNVQFYTQQSVNIHMQAVHQKLKPLSCTFCAQSFATTDQQKAHETSMHKKPQKYDQTELDERSHRAAQLVEPSPKKGCYDDNSDEIGGVSSFLGDEVKIKTEPLQMQYTAISSTLAETSSLQTTVKAPPSPALSASSQDTDSGYGTPSPVPIFVLPISYQSPVPISDKDSSAWVGKRTLLGKEAVAILNDWYEGNMQCPYPSPDTITRLAEQAKLSVEQVKHWFNNRRNRSSNRVHQEHSCENHILLPSGRCHRKSKRQANNHPLSTEAVQIMNNWYLANITRPYPDDNTIASLVEQTLLNPGQIRKWFANRRMRSRNTYKQTGGMNPLVYYGKKRQQRRQQKQQHMVGREPLNESSEIKIDSVCSLVVHTKTES